MKVLWFFLYRIKLFIGSSFHAFFLIFLTFFFLNSSFVHWDEGELVWVNNFIKKFVLNVDEKPNSEEFIFINVAYDNLLVNKLDKNGFVVGNQDITDRVKLTKFFKALKKADTHKFVLCDIHFSENSHDDLSLSSAFFGVKRFVASTHNVPYKSLFDIPMALSNYDNDGNFLKFKYINNKQYKSTPLVMYEGMGKLNTTLSSNLLQINDRYFLNNGILDLRVRGFDITKNQSVQDSSHFHLKYMHLGEMLLMDSLLQGNFIPNEINNRIVVLGDFEDRDLHSTVVGNIPGPLILVNAYLALQYGDNEVTLVFLFFLWLSYFVLSIIIFSSNEFTKNKMNIWIPSLIRFQFIIEFIGYFVYLFLLSLLCYVFFSVQISIIFIAIYIKVIDWIMESFVFKQKAKKLQ